MAQDDFRFGISASVQGADLNKLLIEHAPSTYFMRAATDIDQLGLLAGDILVVDRSLSPKKQDLVVVAEEDDPQLKITKYAQLTASAKLWGVVVHLVRRMRP